MKIFSWMQNKLYGRHSNKNPSPLPANYRREEGCKEEFSDWPHGLLAIGTFGINKIEKPNPPQGNEPSSSQDHHLQDLTAEEVERLQNELEQIIEDNNMNIHVEGQTAAEQIQQEECCDDLQGRNIGMLEIRSNSMVPSRKNEVCLEGKKSVVGKKSLSFLLKKMFVCTSEFATAPTPSPRDHHFPESRVEKILREILHKKIYPQTQSYSPKVGAMKYLESRDMKSKRGHEEEKMGNGDEGSKWVKTDSEYIVLEI